MRNPSTPFLKATALCSLLLAGCTSVPMDDAPLTETISQTKSHVEGVPGGVMSQLVTLVATIEKVDAKTRVITLVDAKGQRKDLKLGPSVTRLDTLKPGDSVKVEYREELAVFVKGAPTSPGKAAPAPAAADKPQVVTTESKEQTAIVKALDLEYHTATLRFPDGGERTYLVREDVKLDKSQIGREIVFRQSETLGISVEPR